VPSKPGGISVTLRAGSAGMTDDDVEDRHSALESAVRAVYEERPVVAAGEDTPDDAGRVAVSTASGPRRVPAAILSREGLFASVEDLCRHGQGARLNAMMRAVAAERAAALVAALTQAGTGAALLARLSQEWLAWCRQVSAVRQVTLYLDRSLVSQGEASLGRAPSQPEPASSSTGSALGSAAAARSAAATALAGSSSGVWAEAAIQVRSALLAEPEGGSGVSAHERVAEAVLAAVADDRAGSLADRSSARVAVRCLWDLGLYGSADDAAAAAARPTLASRLVAGAKAHWGAVAAELWDTCGFPALVDPSADPASAPAPSGQPVHASGVARFLLTAEAQIAAETERFASALDPAPTASTGRACVASAEHALLGRTWRDLVRAGLPALLAAGRADNLRRLRQLVIRAGSTARPHSGDALPPGEEAVLAAFRAHARQSFEAAVKAGRAAEPAAPASKARKGASTPKAADGPGVVPLLLASRRILETAALVMAGAPAHAEATTAASSSSSSSSAVVAVVPDRALDRALREAAADAMSAEPAAVSEALAKHFDVLMRGGPKAAAATSSVAETAATIPGHEVAASAAASSSLPPSVAAAAASASAGPPATDPEASSAECLWLFRCLRAKDVFEAFYRKDLAKRLLLDRSASSDTELSVVAALKAECGPKFTAKLEGMVRDMAACRAVEAAFAKDGPPADDWAREDGAADPRVEFSVRTLTTTHWPSYSAWVPTLPPVLSRPLDAFAGWYKTAHAGRRLVWQHSLGSCTLLGRFPGGRKQLVVSELQSVLLLLFNGREQISFADLRGAVGSAAEPDAAGSTRAGPPSADEVIRAVLALCVPKHRILRRIRPGDAPEPAASSSSSSKPPSALSKRVTDEDVFRFNAGFKSRLHQVRVNQLQLRETRQERSDTAKRVTEARQFQTDAALVRLMKTRKTLRHEQLVAECVAQLRFPARPADIKRRIESLITRDYLERDDDDGALYHYVA